jgi:hypothetical protein
MEIPDSNKFVGKVHDRCRCTDSRGFEQWELGDAKDDALMKSARSVDKWSVLKRDNARRQMMRCDGDL